MKLTKRLCRGGQQLLALSLLLLCGSEVLALSTDKDQPIQVEADGMEVDEGKGITTYSGNVVVIQGSIRLTADKVYIFQSEGNTDRLEAVGKPAYFQQRPDGKDEDVKGNSLRMEYDTNSELLDMIGDAVLFPGDGHKLTSQHITYDRVKAVMKAGAAVAGEKTPVKSGRVQTTLAPRKKSASKK